MARDKGNTTDYAGPLRRLLLTVFTLLLIAVFIVWRIDSPRVERLRAQIVDRIVPNMDWAMAPVTGTVNLFRDFRSYQSLSEQNQELRRELRQMRAWKEAALQLEQENARLLELNNVQLDPQLTYITGVVLADSGSPFRQSVLLNIGARDGIIDGWATMDGIGLVGRISGVAANTSRVLLLTDPNARVPVVIQPSGQRAMLTGDNTARPALDFVENPDVVRAGDRVVSSGDGGVFPAGVLVGAVELDRLGRQRVRLAADYERLEFLRVLRHHRSPSVSDAGAIIRAGQPLPEPAEVEEDE